MLLLMVVELTLLLLMLVELIQLLLMFVELTLLLLMLVGLIEIDFQKNKNKLMEVNKIMNGIDLILLIYFIGGLQKLWNHFYRVATGF